MSKLSFERFDEKLENGEKITLLPAGPTFVPDDVSRYYTINYASSDLEEKFFDLYLETQKNLARLLQFGPDDLNSNEDELADSVVIMSGEAMVVLWGAMKSVLKPGDKVLAVATGVYGFGFGEMAKLLGAEVEYVSLEYDEGITKDHYNLIKQHAEKFRPKLITLVHTETPNGTINDAEVVGRVASEIDSLFYVDFVSSGGATPVRVIDWKIDLGLLGTQKALNLPPDLGIVTISKNAWNIIEKVGYVGYDALLAWKGARTKREFPYTHNWRAVSALNASIKKILANEDEIYERHARVAAFCRRRIREIGLKVYPKTDEICAPGVTAVYVPDNWTWQEFDDELRRHGVVLAGTYGKIQNKVFRIGHMGIQADESLVEKAIQAIDKIIKSRM